jgi:hypothetical protein
MLTKKAGMNPTRVHVSPFWSHRIKRGLGVIFPSDTGVTEVFKIAVDKSDRDRLPGVHPDLWIFAMHWRKLILKILCVQYGMQERCAICFSSSPCKHWQMIGTKAADLGLGGLGEDPQSPPEEPERPEAQTRLICRDSSLSREVSWVMAARVLGIPLTASEDEACAVLDGCQRLYPERDRTLLRALNTFLYYRRSRG